MQALFCLILFVVISLSWASETQAKQSEIVAALDEHLVAIDTGFSGSKVLLFGATQGEGDVIVIVRGPKRQEIVRKKERIMGVWANKEQVAFNDTPSFYNIAATGDIDKLVDENTRKKLEFGADNLRPYIAREHRHLDDEKKQIFWQALLRAKKRDGLYADTTTPVRFLGNRLFRADIEFPSNIPVGNYLVYVHLVKEQKVVNTQITPLKVSKIGVEAEIYNFAHNYSFLYGIVAVIIALVSGWLASVAFRKK